MKTYMVGGAVRDKLLGKKPRDCDFIVVDTQHEQLLDSGFIPVGKDHSVYLHPITKEEYTLAVSLEDDLGRRDLTINAMALDGEKLIDPFHGGKDIENKVLKHIKEENFYNDPLRVYRVARFSSELPDFHIDPSTMALLKSVVKERSFNLITPERVLLETTKALNSERPSIFFKILKELDALKTHFQELDSLAEADWAHTLTVLDKVRAFDNPAASYGALFIHTGPGQPAKLSERLLVSNTLKRTAEIVQEHFRNFQEDLPAQRIVEVLYRIDAYRNSSIVNILSELLISNEQIKSGKRLEDSYELTRNISVGDLSSMATGKDIGLAIKSERIKRLESFLR